MWYYFIRNTHTTDITYIRSNCLLLLLEDLAVAQIVERSDALCLQRVILQVDALEVLEQSDVGWDDSDLIGGEVHVDQILQLEELLGQHADVVLGQIDELKRLQLGNLEPWSEQTKDHGLNKINHLSLSLIFLFFLSTRRTRRRESTNLWMDAFELAIDEREFLEAVPVPVRVEEECRHHRQQLVVDLYPRQWHLWNDGNLKMNFAIDLVLGLALPERIPVVVHLCVREVLERDLEPAPGTRG